MFGRLTGQSTPNRAAVTPCLVVWAVKTPPTAPQSGWVWQSAPYPSAIATGVATALTAAAAPMPMSICQRCMSATVSAAGIT